MSSAAMARRLAPCASSLKIVGAKQDASVNPKIHEPEEPRREHQSAAAAMAASGSAVCRRCRVGQAWRRRRPRLTRISPTWHLLDPDAGKDKRSLRFCHQ